MKKLFSLLLVLTLVLSIFVGCGKTDDGQNDNTGNNDNAGNAPAEKTYSLVVVTDSAFGNNGCLVGNVLVADQNVCICLFYGIGKILCSPIAVKRDQHAGGGKCGKIGQRPVVGHFADQSNMLACKALGVEYACPCASL